MDRGAGQVTVNGVMKRVNTTWTTTKKPQSVFSLLILNLQKLKPRWAWLVPPLTDIYRTATRCQCLVPGKQLWENHKAACSGAPYHISGREDSEQVGSWISKLVSGLLWGFLGWSGWWRAFHTEENGLKWAWAWPAGGRERRWSG